jgi:hypothetical protein
MKRALAALALLALVSGCGSDEKKAEAKPEPKPVQGDTVAIPKEGKPRLNVTLLQVFDPVEADESDKPKKNHHFVGIRIRVENLSPDKYQDAPARGMELITSDERDASLADLSGGDCSDGLGFGVTIKPGEAESMCQPFEVKDGLGLQSFLFTLGTLPETAEWSLAE